MKRVDENTDIYPFDGVTAITVYEGGFDNLQKPVLAWRYDEDDEPVLTLKEIAEQCNSRLITIFIEDPMVTKIYQYGNYGDSWWMLGTIDGYA